MPSAALRNREPSAPLLSLPSPYKYKLFGILSIPSPRVTSMSFLPSVALPSPPFEVNTDQDISPVSPGVIPALRAMAFSVACVSVNLGFAPKSLLIRSTGLDRSPPFFTKTTSYNTYEPSSAPPLFQDRTILSADVTSSITFAGETNSVGTTKSVESRYSFPQLPNKIRKAAIIAKNRYYIIFVL